jgi:hypothetical protein
MKTLQNIIQIFIGQLQVEVYHKGSHNCCNLHNDILLGLKWVEKVFLFNEIHCKENCNVTKLFFNNFFSSYDYFKML